MTSFDRYARWQDRYDIWGDIFGIDSVCPNGVLCSEGTPVHMTDEQKQVVHDNIYENLIRIAKEHPEVEFYYFLPPYSAIWWSGLFRDGTIYKQMEAEKYVIELILEQENIKLFSFNNRTDITTDINHYMDEIHYGIWINSLMLRWMRDGKYQLTKDNYMEYMEREKEFYTTFDYNSLNRQEDYENAYFAAALLNQQLKGIEPLHLYDLQSRQVELSNTQKVTCGFHEQIGYECKGSVPREPNSNCSVSDFLLNETYIGIRANVDDVGDYDYLTFYGRKVAGQGQPVVYVYQNGEVVAEKIGSYREIDHDWHQYLIDVSGIEGAVTVIFNGGYTDHTGGQESSFLFSDITFY